MDKIEQLYNLYLQNGIITSGTSLDMFRTANEQQQNSLYELGKQKNLFQTTDLPTFQSAWTGAAPMATPIQPQEEVKKKVESGTMELPVAGSLSGSQLPQEPVKPQPAQPQETPQFFQSSLDIITPDLINDVEEVVVPKMNYQFGPMGFKFEPSGVTGDWMVATAPNGKQAEFSLDPFLSESAEDEADKLKQWISANTNTSGLATIENQYKGENKKFQSQQDIDKEIKTINQSTESFKYDVRNYLIDKQSIEKEKEFLDNNASDKSSTAYLVRQSSYNANLEGLKKREQELTQKQNLLQQDSQSLSSAVGKYAMMSEQQGTFGGFLWNKLTEGLSMLAPSVVNVITDIGAQFQDVTPTAWNGPKAEAVLVSEKLGYNPPSIKIETDINGNPILANEQDKAKFNDWYNSLTKEEKNNVESKIRDDISKEVKYGKPGEVGAFKAAQVGYKSTIGDSTTDEYSRKLEDDSFLAGALGGVTKSLPAMIGGGGTIGWVQRGIQMYGQATDAIYNEMADNPEFKDVSESEKRAIAMPIGIAEASLEVIGLRNVIANKGLLNRAILAAIGKSGATTTAKTFGELVRNEITSKGLKAGLTLTGAALAEAETGALQQVSEYAFKDIYNAVKEKGMFQTPEFLSKEYFADIGKAAAAEAIGGLILGMPSAVSSAYSKKGYQGMNNQLFNVFEASAKDPEIQRAFVVDLKTRVARGEISLEEARKTLNDYRNSVGLFNSVPENLNTNEKKDAMNLLKEKRDLEQQIEGKDDSLTRRQRTRIGNINTELETLGETAATRPISITLPTGNEVQIEREKEGDLNTLMSEYNQLTEERNEFEKRSKVGADGLFDVVTNTVDFFNSEQELNDELQKRWEQTDLAARQAEIVNEITALATPAAAPAPATQQPGILSSPEATLAAIEQLPTEDRINLVFTQEDGTETPVMGNEQMLSNLYHQAMATPEAERTPAQLDAIDTVQVSLKTQLEQEVQQQAQAQQARPARGKNKGEVFRNTMKSLVSILPGIKVTFHKNETEMKGFAETLGNDVSQQIFGGQNGVIVYDASGKPTNILINEETSDATTLPHEVWHAIFFKAFGDNPQLFNEFRDRTRQILLDNGYNDIVDLLDVFEQTEEYVNSNTQGEEWMVHLGGLLTASDIDATNLSKKSKSLLEQLKGLLNEFAKRITGQPMFLEDATPEDVLDFMVAISDRMSRGESIADFFRNQEERQGEGGTRVKPQIVGEGARLTEEIRADLNVAQQMEDAGKDAKTIRLATGWEKGADGKWRYETADNIPFLKDIVRLVMDYMNENKVEDNVYQKAEYFLPPELMSLYPELNDVTIQFDKSNGESLGEYNPLTNTIRVTIDDSPLKSVSIKNTISTLLHEVQHAIQEIEGFAKGGNPEGFKPDDTVKDYKQKVLSAIINNRLAKQKYRDINDARSYLMDLLTLDANGEGMPIGQFLNGILQDIDKMYDTVLYGGDQSDFNDYLLSDIYDFLNEKKVPENKFDEIVNQFDKFETAVNEIGKSSDFQEIQDNVFEQIEERPRNKYEFYKRIAGEVEARNVQARMNMTPEQRRQTTLQETEDVERKKQTVKQQAGKTGIEENTTRQEFKKIIKEGWRGKRITINSTQYRIDNVSSGFGSPEVTLIDANGNIFYNEQKAFDGRIIKRLPTVSSLSYDLPSEQQVKSQAGKTGVEKAAPKLESLKNIDVKLIRTLSRAGKRVSKGLSVYTKDKKKVVQEAPELSLQYVKENAPELFIKNANLIKNYPIIKGVKEFGSVTTVEQAQEVYGIFTRQIADNLKYLMDNFRDDLRDIATLWYDGANILAQNLGKQYGIITEQASGMIASLSPQKDWYQNVRLAELVMMAFKDNPVMTDKMVAKQKEISIKGLKKYVKAFNAAEAAFKKSRSQKRADKLKEAKDKLEDLQKKSDKVLNDLASYVGTDMNTAPDYLKPYYARLYHEINTTKDYNVLSPDGNVLGIAKKKDGENEKVAWGSYTEIGKAVDIYLDGSQENVTRTLGEMHKIRNFHNNIIDPMSPDKDVTMDTHAVAAALLLPLSGEAKQVKANFGTGTANSAALGIKGLYYAFAEGYNLAAEESGLLPRQVQSITWEAVRGLFTDDFKRNAKKVAEINGIVNDYANKKITLDESRKQIFAAAGGINTPSWATGGPVQDGVGEDTKTKAVGGGSKRVGLGTVGTKRGKPRVKSQIQTEGTSLFRTEEGANIGFQYDTDKVARERFNIYRLKKIGAGSDRVVFDLGDGKVLKIAKTARGLEQNIYEGEAYLTIIPEIFERGLNYVVVEKSDKLKVADMVPTYNEDGDQIGEARASEMINELQRYNQKDFDDNREELQEVLRKYGLQDIMNYNVLWNDFTAIRNWGYKDGMPLHTDGGTFGGIDMLTARPSKSLTDPEFREIYEKSKKAKKEFSDNDVYVKFQKSGNTGIEQVRKVAQRYNVNNQGFAPKQVNDAAMKKELAPFGFSVKRARVDEQGRGGGVFIIDGNGRFFNPFRVKSQRISLGAGRFMDDITAIPGYDRLITEIEGIIKRGKTRGAAPDRIMLGVMNYVMTSAVYERANDVQREQIVRNIQTEFGKRLKSAPSVGRLLGTIKDIKNITLSEKELLKQQIKSLARGARTAVAAYKAASKELVKEIDELRLSGKVTTKQVSSVLKRFANVNMFNDDSVDKFVDYMTKVFEDANYAEKIDRARRLLPTAKRNIRTKIGISEAAAPLLQQMFAINPNLIPDAVLDKYLSLVEMFGEKATVLTLGDVNTVIATTNEILDAVDEEVSLAEELAIRFENYPNKVLDNNGDLDYAATLAQMKEQNVITEEDAKLMQKYKSLILPKVQKPEMTEAEIEQEKDRLISVIGSLSVNDSALPTRDERGLAQELKSLLKPEILKQLSIPQLKNVIKLIDNISNGYLPHYAELTVERLDAINKTTPLISSIKTAVPLMFEKAYSRLKSTFTKKGTIVEMTRRGPTFNIDQVFGDFKTKNIYDSLFKAMSKAQALFDSEINKVNKKLDEAHEAVAKSYANDSNNTLLSSFKMMTYMLQLEYESNPGNKEVHPVSKVLNATIKHIDNGKSRYGDREANMLEQILKDYAPNGEIDINRLYDSFNPAEKKAIKTIQELNKSMRDKAVYTAAVIRGDRINPLNNYVHHYVMHEFNPDENATGVQTADAYNNSMRPSTRAQSLIERTNKVSPMNFDVFASAQRGAKFVLLDYTMTKPIRTGRKTLNQARVELEKDGRIPKEQRETLNAIESAFNEVVANVLTNNMITDSRVEEIVNFISKTGYRAILGSVPRFVSELTSNLGTVIFDPKSFADGVKLFKKINGVDAENIMKNSKSVQTNRLYGGQALSGKFIDTSVLGQTTGIKSAEAKGDVANVVNKIYNNSLKKYKNFVELTADTLISTPDRLVMRPFWLGAYANAFKKETGQDIDLDKVAANDEAYMNEYKDAIDKATDAADTMSVRVGATDNPFMGILKGTVKPNQSVFTRAFNNFNNFMTRFAIYEYTTAREGIYAAMGNGMITKRQGYALLAGVATRMTVYTLLSQMLGNGMLSLFADDDEDDEKTFMQKFSQSLASTATGLIIGRNFGNATKSLLNYGVEEMNEKFLTGLREGDYDPYKDAISYSIIPKERKGHKTNLTDFLTQIGGSFGPSLKTADLIARKMFEAPKKEEAAIERGKKETQIRIPLEVLGNLGYVPLYKDIRKIVMDQMYKDLENAGKKADDKKQAEKEMLRGYENKTDMKRYNPELYEQVFGEKSPGYDAEQAKKKIEKEKDDLERRRKDEFYEYTPKKTQEESGGFGSKPFGGKAKKESGGFGSKKFGE